MIPTKEMQYLTTPDHIQLYATGWNVEGARGAVLLVHGIGEHSGRYPHVIAALTVRGYSVYTYDQRGHGKSGGPRAYFETPDVLPQDLELVAHTVREDTYGLPLFVYGHSMGSLVTLAWALDHPDGLAGLVLTGAPLDFDAKVSPVLAATAKVMNKVLPRLQALDVVNPKDLSHDPAVIKAYTSDPLNYHGRLSVRSGSNLLDLLTSTRDRLPELTVPLLILHGEADAVCPVSGSIRLDEQAGSVDKTLIVYPGLYHEIHNEPEQVTVIKDILAWLDEHTV
jgi:acylglycerol lipase